MFHFSRFPPIHLCIQCRVMQHYLHGVSPFGYLRIKGCLPPPRSFSQAATSFIGTFCLAILRMLLWCSTTTSLFDLVDIGVVEIFSTTLYLVLRICFWLIYTLYIFEPEFSRETLLWLQGDKKTAWAVPDRNQTYDKGALPSCWLIWLYHRAITPWALPSLHPSTKPFACTV